MRPKPYHRLLLLIILLVSLSLRLARLGADSLWYDETVSTYLAGQPLPELVRHTAGDIHPPAYYALLRGWLQITGYGDGRADKGNGLEFMAAFFSLFFGVLLCALVYRLARLMTGPPVAMLAAALVALSPYHIWYSQEVRMYTLAAALGVVALHALIQATRGEKVPSAAGSTSQTRHKMASESRCTFPYTGFAAEVGIGHASRLRLGWWMLYAFAAAAGMYTLYYFVFLLLPINLWALITFMAVRSPGQRWWSQLRPWVLANVVAGLLYLPWLPVAWRQATDPPVPPWRSAVSVGEALQEGWTALVLGQSAPPWLWPVALLMLGLYCIGLVTLVRRDNSPTDAQARSSQGAVRAVLTRGVTTVGWLVVAVFGPLALILLLSAITPLYHVRYLFTYSPGVYIPLGAGVWRLWSAGRNCWIRRAGGMAVISLWLVGATATLRAAWADPLYRADDHRAAVRFLEERWRPGDVVLVNAGYAYTALLTYWQGPVAYRGRIAEALPAPRDDAALIAVTTGHLDGPPTLGWGDSRSDFFALSSRLAAQEIESLFQRFPRVWHYRIYDTVNDPEGRLRIWLIEQGQMVEERQFAGEANLRVQCYVPRQGTDWKAEWPAVEYVNGLRLQWEPLVQEVMAGRAIYPVVTWLKTRVDVGELSTSLRLIGPDGAVWSQPVDEHPLGSLFPARQWPPGIPQRQPLALPIPQGVPPGEYTVTFLAYESTTGEPLQVLAAPGVPLTPHGVVLRQLSVLRSDPAPAPRKAVAIFGPLALVEASSPATIIAAGGQVPVELLWQARQPPGEPLVIVIQLLDPHDRVIASLEEQPLGGRYPTSGWTDSELVRDRHTLEVPAGSPPGHYRLIVGVYRSVDRVRLITRSGPFGQRTYHVIKAITVQ